MLSIRPMQCTCVDSICERAPALRQSHEDAQNVNQQQEPTQEAAQKQLQKESPSAGVVRLAESPQGL